LTKILSSLFHLVVVGCAAEQYPEIPLAPYQFPPTIFNLDSTTPHIIQGIIRSEFSKAG
jgi:hypothetical protein